MSIHIQQVLDYLDDHPICARADSVNSLLEMLHEIYAMHNCLENEDIRKWFRSLRSWLEPLPRDTQDQFFHIVCDLCLEHEQLAFSQGSARECC